MWLYTQRMYQFLCGFDIDQVINPYPWGTPVFFPAEIFNIVFLWDMRTPLVIPPQTNKGVSHGYGLIPPSQRSTSGKTPGHPGIHTHYGLLCSFIRVKYCGLETARHQLTSLSPPPPNLKRGGTRGCRLVGCLAGVNNVVKAWRLWEFCGCEIVGFWSKSWDFDQDQNHGILTKIGPIAKGVAYDICRVHLARIIN